jgi:hypothetical protein
VLLPPHLVEASSTSASAGARDGMTHQARPARRHADGTKRAATHTGGKATCRLWCFRHSGGGLFYQLHSHVVLFINELDKGDHFFQKFKNVCYKHCQTFIVDAGGDVLRASLAVSPKASPKRRRILHLWDAFSLCRVYGTSLPSHVPQTEIEIF